VIKLDRQDAVWILTMCNGENRFNRLYGEVMASCGIGPGSGAGE